MLIVLHFVMGVLLIISFLGYMKFVRKALSLRWEFIPVFVFSSIACLVFISGLAGQLFTGSLVILIAGLLLYGECCFSGCAEGIITYVLFYIPIFIPGRDFCFLAGALSEPINTLR